MTGGGQGRLGVVVPAERPALNSCQFAALMVGVAVLAFVTTYLLLERFA